jgi:bacillithiol biosynthesis cysteine-adding enzyme BshC
LNLEILVSRPKGSPLVRSYVEGEGAAAAFFPGHFADHAAYVEKASEVDGRFDRGDRERAAAAMRVPEGGDPGRLRRFVEEGGYVVTTGQQPGLFGGPLYSLYKGLTAIRLAAALEALMGRPVLPVFWIASDDHDWAEANHTSIVGIDNELHTPALAAPDPDIHPPLHRISAGPEVSGLLGEFLQNLPNTDFSAPYLELLRGAVSPDSTLPRSFAAILEALLGPLGMVFTDAADPALKAASMPLLLAELERGAELEAVLAATAERLTGGGHGLQVALMEGGVNLFLEGAAGRERLYREGDGFRLRISGEHLTADEVRARATDDPSSLSPNVLLRPVAESVVFPTLSYVAGPGEMAYFAQLADYFQAHGVLMPVIHPRFGATVVEGKIRKVLEKFSLDVPDLDRPFHEIAGEIARDEVPDSVKRALGGLRGAIGKGVGELQDAVKGVDPTLKGPVQHVRSQAFAALDDVEKKVVHAVKRENEIALAQLEKAQLHLFPLGKPQERVMNPFYYLFRYGGAFLEEMMERFEVNVG